MHREPFILGRLFVAALTTLVLAGCGSTPEKIDEPVAEAVEPTAVATPAPEPPAITADPLPQMETPVAPDETVAPTETSAGGTEEPATRVDEPVVEEPQVAAPEDETLPQDDGAPDEATSVDAAVDQAPEPLVETTTPPADPDVTLRTQPSGGEIVVNDTGEIVADGNNVTLAPGEYRLTARKPGHRDRDETITIDADAAVDATIRLGTQYAQILITAIPARTIVEVDGDRVGTTPITIDLDAGEHVVTATLADHETRTRSITVEPDGSAELRFELPRIPFASLVTVRTEPAGGVITFAGKEYSGDMVEVGSLAEGEYMLNAVKVLDAESRLVGSAGFEVNSNEPTSVVIPLRNIERLQQNTWVAEAQYLEQELPSYRAQRVVNPVHVTVKSTTPPTGSDLAPELAALMRVGDRVEFVIGSNRWMIWKRRNELTPQFKAEVTGLEQGTSYRSPWSRDDGATDIAISPSQATLADLAFALYRGRAPAAMLDLGAEQLSPVGETIFRTSEDGAITVLVDGEITSEGVTFKPVGNLRYTELPASNDQIKFRWSSRPSHLLVFSNAATPLRTIGKIPPLMKREKRFIDLVQGRAVAALMRLSHGPDYSGWLRQILRAQGAVASQINLATDTIGPHSASGSYVRTWLVQYREGEHVSQRQMSLSYEVGEEVLPAGSGKILRH